MELILSELLFIPDDTELLFDATQLKVGSTLIVRVLVAIQ